MGSLSPVTRPAVRWFGGKWPLAPWIIGHFPPHRAYVEPYGGGGSVLLRKPRSYADIYNDLDGEVVNLFRVLRDETASARLIELLRLTPFAREEFKASYGESVESIERARLLVTRSFLGFGSNAHAKRSTSFRSSCTRNGTTPAHDWRRLPDALHATVERLQGVVIENKSALDVMAQHDAATTLHYVDPPYVWSARGRHDKQRQYQHELTDADHVALLEFLQGVQGMVVLSGYPSALYDDALVKWRRIDKAAFADGARKRTEVLWLNPACAAALAARRETLPLFAAVG